MASRWLYAYGEPWSTSLGELRLQWFPLVGAPRIARTCSLSNSYRLTQADRPSNPPDNITVAQSRHTFSELVFIPENPFRNIVYRKWSGCYICKMKFGVTMCNIIARVPDVPDQYLRLFYKTYAHIWYIWIVWHHNCTICNVVGRLGVTWILFRKKSEAFMGIFLLIILGMTWQMFSNLGNYRKTGIFFGSTYMNNKCNCGKHFTPAFGSHKAWTSVNYTLVQTLPMYACTYTYIYYTPTQQTHRPMGQSGVGHGHYFPVTTGSGLTSNDPILSIAVYQQIALAAIPSGAKVNYERVEPGYNIRRLSRNILLWSSFWCLFRHLWPVGMGSLSGNAFIYCCLFIII